MVWFVRIWCSKSPDHSIDSPVPARLRVAQPWAGSSSSSKPGRVHAGSRTLAMQAAQQTATRADRTMMGAPPMEFMQLFVVTPLLIKRYASRRLYNTDTSTYVTLDDLAAMLGYSEQSSFGRAFKRWTGMTPGQYRKLHGSGTR